jgi:hypothetical protein
MKAQLSSAHQTGEPALCPTALHAGPSRLVLPRLGSAWLGSASGGFAKIWLGAGAEPSKMDGFGVAQLGYGLATAPYIYRNTLIVLSLQTYSV